MKTVFYCLFISLGLSIQLFSQPCMPEYKYRRMFQVNTSILIDSQFIQLDIDVEQLVENGKVNSDYSDLHVCNILGEFFPVFIDSSDIHVKVWINPFKLNIGKTTLFLFYGNPVSSYPTNKLASYVAIANPINYTVIFGNEELITNLEKLFVQSNSPICEGGTLQLSATNKLNAYYRWHDANGFLFSEKATPPAISDITISQGGYFVLKLIEPATYCDTQLYLVPVDINKIPIAGNIVIPENICEGDNEGEIKLQYNIGNVWRWQQFDLYSHQWITISENSQIIKFENLTNSFDIRAIVSSMNCGFDTS